MSTQDPHCSVTRREFLGVGAAMTGLGMAALSGCADARALRAGAGPASDDPEELLDRALARIDARLPHANVHSSNHAPMVVEALCVLGRAEAIAPWLDENLARFEPATGARAPIDAEHWCVALGDHGRFPDWREFFQRELHTEDWRTVLRRWAARFAPGLAGAATHGVIRTGHAARALAARDNALRRGALANGLAYWAVNHEELPWDGSVAPERSVEAALAKVVPRQPVLLPPPGNIVTGLRALSDTPSFRPVAGLVDTSDPARTLSELTAACARLYLANPGHRIAFTHSITAPSALRLLVPYLDDESIVRATRYAWQAAAGLYVVYGDPRRTVPDTRAGAERDALVAAAIQNGGAHSIKLTEACLREEALSHDPILLQAAHDASKEMNG